MITFSRDYSLKYQYLMRSSSRWRRRDEWQPPGSDSQMKQMNLSMIGLSILDLHSEYYRHRQYESYKNPLTQLSSHSSIILSVTDMNRALFWQPLILGRREKITLNPFQILVLELIEQTRDSTMSVNTYSSHLTSVSLLHSTSNSCIDSSSSRSMINGGENKETWICVFLRLDELNLLFLALSLFLRLPKSSCESIAGIIFKQLLLVIFLKPNRRIKRNLSRQRISPPTANDSRCKQKYRLYQYTLLDTKMSCWANMFRGTLGLVQDEIIFFLLLSLQNLQCLFHSLPWESETLRREAKGLASYQDCVTMSLKRESFFFGRARESAGTDYTVAFFLILFREGCGGMEASCGGIACSGLFRRVFRDDFRSKLYSIWLFLDSAFDMLF